jgi:hypothetical protein
MLRNNDILIPQHIRLHPLINLRAPTPLLKHLGVLDPRRRHIHVLPARVVAVLELLVQRVVDGDPRCSGSVYKLLHVRDGVGRRQTLRHAGVGFALRVQEVVVRVHEDYCCVWGGHGGWRGSLRGWGLFECQESTESGSVANADRMEMFSRANRSIPILTCSSHTDSTEAKPT